MSTNPTIYTALVPFVLGGWVLLSQSSSSTLPNALATLSLFVASVQSGSVANPLQPARQRSARSRYNFAISTINFQTGLQP
jgi:hypothetical protein